MLSWITILLAILIVVITALAGQGRLSANGMIGIRTPATQRDERSWEAGHRAAMKVVGPGAAIAAIGAVLQLVGVLGAGDAVSGTILGLLVAVIIVAAIVADRAARATAA